MWHKIVLGLCFILFSIVITDISKKEYSAFGEKIDFSAAIKNIEPVFDKAVEEKNLHFAPEAKYPFFKDIIYRESSKGLEPFKISVSYEESSNLVNLIDTKVQEGETVTANLTSSVIVETKVNQVRGGLADQIIKSANISGVDLTEGARIIIEDDLLNQTERAAKSELTVQEINERNEQYLYAIYAIAPSKQLDEKTYQKACRQLFQPLIKLTINSTPSGASVEISGTPIGKTTIEEKRFEPKKEYSFVFRLSGYKTSVRKYFVEPYPLKQEFTEILFQEK